MRQQVLVVNAVAAIIAMSDNRYYVKRTKRATGSSCRYDLAVNFDSTRQPGQMSYVHISPTTII